MLGVAGRRYWLGYVAFWIVLGTVSLLRSNWWLVAAAACGFGTAGVNLWQLRRSRPAD